jgi:hypothetical protein
MAYNNARNGTIGVNTLLEELETSGVMKSAGLKDAEKLALQESFRKTRNSKNSDLYGEVEISIRKGKWGSIKRQTNEIVKKETANTRRSDTKNTKFEQPKTSVNTGSSVLIESLPETLKSVHNRLVNGGMQFVEEGNVIKYLDKNGDEIARIENGVFSVSKEKLSIPEPLTYLDATYITNHINRFKQEGAGFIVVKSWTEGGNPKYGTLPQRKFVGLRSEMDAVIAKYKAQGNDWKVLRDDLNLGPTTDLSGEEIYYIKISGDDPRFTYDMPNGNEGGAIVGEWVPGGYTKNGTTEAALIGSENVVHSKDINKLLDNFPGMWEKIK